MGVRDEWIAELRAAEYERAKTAVASAEKSSGGAIILYGDSFADDSPRIRALKAKQLVGAAFRDSLGNAANEFAAAASLVAASADDFCAEEDTGEFDTAEPEPCRCPICERVNFGAFIARQREQPSVPYSQATADRCALEWSRQLREKIAASAAVARERERLQVVVDYDDF